eukprot:scpid35353/ scgid18980/ 
MSSASLNGSTCSSPEGLTGKTEQFETVEDGSHRGNAKTQPRSGWRKHTSIYRWIATRTFVVAIFVPLLCAGIGAIVDRILFGPVSLGNTTHFNTRHMAYSGLLAAPFVLVRLAIGSGLNRRLTRYLTAADFVIYIVQTVGMAVAFSHAMLAGPDVYNAFAHARSVYTVNGLYEKIQTEQDVYTWLNQLTGNIFDESFPNNKGSRLIQHGSRLYQQGSLRLRQYRVKPVQCPDAAKSLGLVAGHTCYPKFHDGEEDRSPFTSMNFTYNDEPYKTFTGDTVFSHDFGLYAGTQWYTYASFWQLFPNDVTSADAQGQLRAMQSVGWIDWQTRLIAIDVPLFAPDLSPVIWGVVNMAVEVTPTGRFVPTGFDVTYSYMPLTTSEFYIQQLDQPSEEIGLNRWSKGIYEGYTYFPNTTSFKDANRYLAEYRASNPKLFESPCFVLVDNIFLIPFYYGMFSAALYTVQIHMSVLRASWRAYLKRVFTFTELLCVAVLILSLAFRWTAIDKQQCGGSQHIQEPFITATTREAEIRTGVATLLELQAQATFWSQARNFMGFAFFLHLFNFLKFLVKFKSLGTLVRTLSAAASDLLSFSISFIVIFLAFVTMHFVLFSVDVEQYSSFLRSISSLWLGMLGELEVTDALWRRHQWALPMMILFTFISVFVLLTLIVAIISNAHDHTKTLEEEKLVREQFLLRDALASLEQRIRPSTKRRVAPAGKLHGSTHGKGLSAAGPFSSNIRRRLGHWQRLSAGHQMQDDSTGDAPGRTSPGHVLAPSQAISSRSHSSKVYGRQNSAENQIAQPRPTTETEDELEMENRIA